MTHALGNLYLLGFILTATLITGYILEPAKSAEHAKTINQPTLKLLAAFIIICITNPIFLANIARLHIKQKQKNAKN